MKKDPTTSKDYTIKAINRGRGVALLNEDVRGDIVPTTLADDIIIHLENNGYLVEIEEAE